jgi:hypothetical protein
MRSSSRCRSAMPSAGMPMPIIVESLDVPVLWELAAFTADLESFGHPVTDGGRLTSAWFTNKVTYRVTSSAFGFACPAGSLAIVDLVASEIDDSRLVIALRGKSIFARRFLRNDADPTYVALGSEAPNPAEARTVALRPCRSSEAPEGGRSTLRPARDSLARSSGSV